MSSLDSLSLSPPFMRCLFNDYSLFDPLRSCGRGWWRWGWGWGWGWGGVSVSLRTSLVSCRGDLPHKSSILWGEWWSIIGARRVIQIWIDWEKTYDKVSREVLWRCLEVRGLLVAYTRAIENTFNRAKTRVRTVRGDSQHFPIMMGCTRNRRLAPFFSQGLWMYWCGIFKVRDHGVSYSHITY